MLKRFFGFITKPVLPARRAMAFGLVNYFRPAGPSSAPHLRVLGVLILQDEPEKIQDAGKAE